LLNDRRKQLLLCCLCFTHRWAQGFAVSGVGSQGLLLLPGAAKSSSCLPEFTHAAELQDASASRRF
jgi:hypothetical protein